MAKKVIKKKATKKVAKKKPARRKIINMLDVSSIQPQDYLRVSQINANSNNLHEALGITKERFEELEIICFTALKRSNKFSEAMENASKDCKHANELAMCISILEEERHAPPPFIQMLAGLAQRGRKGPDPNQQP